MTDKEIQDTFKLLGISEKRSEQELNLYRFIDKKPLSVKFQTTTSVKT